MNLLSQDLWIISVLPVGLYPQTAKGRAQFLIERVSLPEAQRLASWCCTAAP